MITILKLETTESLGDLPGSQAAMISISDGSTTYRLDVGIPLGENAQEYLDARSGELWSTAVVKNRAVAEKDTAPLTAKQYFANSPAALAFIRLTPEEQAAQIDAMTLAQLKTVVKYLAVAVSALVKMDFLNGV